MGRSTKHLTRPVHFLLRIGGGGRHDEFLIKRKKYRRKANDMFLLAYKERESNIKEFASYFTTYSASSMLFHQLEFFLQIILRLLLSLFLRNFLRIDGLLLEHYEKMGIDVV
jgi:cadmium resistance protein CadD (predicted permease)